MDLQYNLNLQYAHNLGKQLKSIFKKRTDKSLVRRVLINYLMHEELCKAMIKDNVDFDFVIYEAMQFYMGKGLKELGD